MTNSKYWKERGAKARIQLLDKTIENMERELATTYRGVSSTIIAELKALYLEAETLNDLYRYNRYYEILNQIDALLTELTGKQEVYISKELTKLYESNRDVLKIEIGAVGAAKVAKNTVERAVFSAWCADGMVWSDRIWKNKTLLRTALEKTMVEMVGAGKSVDYATKELMGVMNVGYNNAVRIIRTESAHVQNVSTADLYKEVGIEKYQILTEDDCCDECEELAQHTYRVDDIVIPAHPNCRCCMVAVDKPDQERPRPKRGR